MPEPVIIIFTTLGVLAVIGICFSWALISKNPKRNTIAAIAGITAVFLLVYIDRTKPQKVINSMGVLVHKTYVPAEQGQSHYAFLVVRGERHWLFRVPRQTWLAYDNRDRLRLVHHRGRISGITYKTTLHQPLAYVHE